MGTVAAVLSLYAVLNSAEERGWAAPAEGTVAAATIERAVRSDGSCGVTARFSRCYHLTLNVEAPIAGPRELDVNIEDRLFHRFDSGQSTRVVALRDGRIALDRTLLE